MYDSIATLYSYTNRFNDEYGNPVVQENGTEVFVQPRSVYQSEYYNAAQVGLKPSLTLFIANREDYSGEKELEFEGKRYEVIRTDWNAQRDGISLVCEEKARVGRKVEDVDTK